MAEARFKIEITEVGEERKTLSKEWAVVGKDDKDNPRYGYTPETETICGYERLVYTQNVADLSLEAVICAVNGINTTPKGGA